MTALETKTKQDCKLLLIIYQGVCFLSDLIMCRGTKNLDKNSGKVQSSQKRELTFELSHTRVSSRLKRLNHLAQHKHKTT